MQDLPSVQSKVKPGEGLPLPSILFFMKAKLVATITGYDPKENYIDGWGAGRLWEEEEEILAGTEMEIIGHTMLFIPKTQWTPEHYEPVVIVAYNNRHWWIDGNEVKRIAYLNSNLLKIID